MQIGPLIMNFELMHAYWYFKAIAKMKQPFILQYAEAGWEGGGGKWNNTRGREDRRHHIELLPVCSRIPDRQAKGNPAYCTQILMNLLPG